MHNARIIGWSTLLAFTISTAGCSSSTEAGGKGGALSKLPVPAGATSTYADDNIAMYVTEAPVDATVAECKKLLLADGWVPYGEAGPTWFFKRDLNQLTAMISSAPAQGGKTMIQYTQSKMAADLPPAPDAKRMQYADSLKRLDFDSSTAMDDLFSKYAEALKKSGWEPTTEKPITDGPKAFQIFRNAQKDMLELEVRDVSEVRRGHLKFSTAAEVEEMDRKFKAEQERRKQEADKAKAN